MLFEVNEAFAVIDVLFDPGLPGDAGTLQPAGGALAYGHPYGASGALLLLHLLKSLESCGGHYVAFGAAAAAGGIGSAILLGRR
ncbi:MAG: thiolase [Clostridium sp.]